MTACAQHTPILGGRIPGTLTRLRHIVNLYEADMSTVLTVADISKIVEALDALDWINRNPGAHPETIHLVAAKGMENIE